MDMTNELNFFGSQGVISVENRKQSTVIRGDQNGFTSDKLDFSFPQRFKHAFEFELETFVAVARGLKKWPITKMDCMIVQSIAKAASQSALTNRVVQFDFAMKGFDCDTYKAFFAVQPVGNGLFGSYIRSILTKTTSKQISSTIFPKLVLLEPITRSSRLNLHEVIASDKKIDAVYICTPDADHFSQALACVKAYKHVLVEKPVYPDFMTLSSQARKFNKVLMVGFHRRFATEFVKAQKHLEQLAKPNYIVVR